MELILCIFSFADSSVARLIIFQSPHLFEKVSIPTPRTSAIATSLGVNAFSFSLEVVVRHLLDQP